MDYVKFFFSNKKAHLVTTQLAARLKAKSFESASFIEKIKIIEPYLKKHEKIVLKLFFWENYDCLYTYMSTLGITNIVLIKAYKGRNLPGIVLINLDKYNEIFIRNLLLCHFNYDFSIHPNLNIHPHFLIKNNQSITILDIYDDRGMYVLNEDIVP